jgi:GTPase SAR1 family protein
MKIIFAEAVDDVPGSALEPKLVEEKAEDEKQIARKTKPTTAKAKTNAKSAPRQTDPPQVIEVRGEDLEDVPDEVRKSMKIIFAEAVDDMPGSALEPKPAEKKAKDKKQTTKKTKPTKAKAKTNAKSAPRPKDRSR